MISCGEGEGEQWLLVRNACGEELLALLGDEVATRMPGSAGKRHGPVKGFLANVQRAAGGLPRSACRSGCARSSAG